MKEIVEDVLKHAAESAPSECCGLAVNVKGKLVYWPCKNIGTVKDSFIIDPKDYIAAEEAGDIVGVCHSHVHLSPEPSQADLIGCEESQLPWLIVSYPSNHYKIITPSNYQAPLLGRVFHWGVTDCYSLIKDYYERELGISMPNPQRDERFWLKGQNLYMEGYKEAGFEAVTKLEKHDIIFMQIASPIPNHAAIYIGNDQILQHLDGRLSARYNYGGYWRKVSRLFLRHRSLM